MWIKLITAFCITITALAVLFGSAQAADCQFVLGFAIFRDIIGHEDVGECLENEQHFDWGATQRTTEGVFIWIKADGGMSFHDGSVEVLPGGCTKSSNGGIGCSGAAVAPTPAPTPTAAEIGAARFSECFISSKAFYVKTISTRPTILYVTRALRWAEQGSLEEYLDWHTYAVCRSWLVDPDPLPQLVDSRLAYSLEFLRQSGPRGEYWWNQIMQHRTSVFFDYKLHVESGIKYPGYASGGSNLITAWHPDLNAYLARERMAEILVHEMAHILQYNERERLGTQKDRTTKSCYQDEIDAERHARDWYFESTGNSKPSLSLESISASPAHKERCESYSN